MSRLFCFLVITAAFISVTVYGHEGHVHGPELTDQPAATTNAAASPGAIVLAETSIINLQVETVIAQIATLEKVLEIPARLEYLPEKHAVLTARFEGKVSRIHVKQGQAVSLGDPVMTLDPVSIGNPPVILRSRLSGHVASVNAIIGQAFTPETILAEVGDSSVLLAKGSAYEINALHKVELGSLATLKVEMFPDAIFNGNITRKDIGVGPENRVAELYVGVENASLQLLPYTSGTLFVQTESIPGILSVPRRAVLGEIGNLFVFVRNGNSFERRTVVLGIKSGELVEVLEGVFPGENVVVKGNYQLQYLNPSAVAPVVAEEQTRSWFWWIIAGVVTGAALLLIGLYRKRPELFRQVQIFHRKK